MPRRRPRSVPAARAARHPLCRRGESHRVRRDLDAPGSPTPGEELTSLPVRLLLVVDGGDPGRRVREMLHERGYAVVAVVGSAADAVAATADLAPHGALVDARLPDGNGFELAARLTDVRPTLSVLITSVEFDDNFGVLAEVSGARGFLPRHELADADLSRFWPAPRASTHRRRLTGESTRRSAARTG